MRRADKVLLTMGSAMLISSAAAIAGPPAGFGGYDQYSVTNGTINYAPTTAGSDPLCPSGYTCGAAITGNGFFQRQVTATDGTKYFETITTSLDATATIGALSTLEFSDQNFVKQGGGTGIADKQHVFAASTTDNPGDFASDTTINGGWAKPTTSDLAIDVVQTIQDTGNGFDLTFNLQDASTDNSAPVVTIDENVSLYTAGNINSAPTDRQSFYLKQLKAPSAGTSNPLPTSASTLPTISWAQDEIIQAMWLGQEVTAGTGGAQDFGAQSFTNVTTSATTSYSDQSATGPWNWQDPPFGTAPTF